MSNGNKIANPKLYRNAEQRLKILQKRASKKQKSSRNKQKANLKVALLHEKIHNQRKDFIYKTIRYLFDKNQANTFCLETLNTSGMIKIINLLNLYKMLVGLCLIKFLKENVIWRAKIFYG